MRGKTGFKQVHLKEVSFFSQDILQITDCNDTY